VVWTRKAVSAYWTAETWKQEYRQLQAESMRKTLLKKDKQQQQQGKASYADKDY
jgi:hypothetical protein